MSHIRIESNEKVATNFKVFYVEGDVETDISSCLQGVDLHVAVGETVTANLKAIVGNARSEALVEGVLVKHMRLRRRGPWRRLRDVTAFGDRTRRYT